MQPLDKFIETSKKELENVINYIDFNQLQKAADIIINAEKTHNRIHITGIGKPAHIAGYIASLMSSTGTPTYFLHGTEAVHGSCGQLVAGDVVICISNSGETAELKATAIAIKNNGGKIISVTGNSESWLSKFADVALFAGVSNEGGPLNRAPRTSIMAETLVLQALSVILQANKNITPEEYILHHPGGALGKLRENEK